MLRITDDAVQKFEEEHIEAVRKAGPECALFLKREDNAFPVHPCRIAAYGSGVRKTIKGGTGSGDVNVRSFVTIEQGLKNAGFEITSGEWLDAYDACMVSARAQFVEDIKREAAEAGVSPVMYGMGKAMPEPEYQFELTGEGDVCIYVLSRISGEGADRAPVAGDINLTETEIRDIKACSEKYEKFLLVLNVGGMVNLEPVKEIKNILLLGMLGTPTGDVLADIMTGKSNPSGKLSMTWAPIENYPSTVGFGDPDDTEYPEGIYVGYRYFDIADASVTYPFGYGKSYTEFELNTQSATGNEEEITLTVNVKNIGAVSGKEVAQLYVSAPAGKLDKPSKELKAFAKTGEIKPGCEETVKLSFPVKDLANYDTETASYILEKGDYIVRIGNSSDNTRPAALIRLDADAVVKKCRNICPGGPAEPLTLKRQETVEDLAGLTVISISASNIKTETVSYTEADEKLPTGKEGSWQDVMAGKLSLEDFAASLSDEELAYLNIGLYQDGAGMGSMIGAAAMSVAGAAGETTDRLKAKGVPSLVMADGPAGIRVSTQYKLVDGKVKAMDNPLAQMFEFMDQEMLQQIAAMAPQPTQEELDAPVNYVYCTAIPVGTALAQSFNTGLVAELGDVVGDEMEKFGINLWLAPAMNIHRSPLCGRDFEYYSEDPVLSGYIAAAVNTGVQKHKGCGTCIKHYALNNQETNRTHSNSIASERAIREIYLRNFEICIRECQPATLMSSYNLVNGIHSNNSRDLLTYVLRDEWGYEGFVMTDWYAANDLMANPNAKDKHPQGDPSGCTFAGNDMVMPGMASDFSVMMAAIDNDSAQYRITRANLETSAVRVLNVIKRLA